MSKLRTSESHSFAAVMSLSEAAIVGEQIMSKINIAIDFSNRPCDIYIYHKEVILVKNLEIKFYYPNTKSLSIIMKYWKLILMELMVIQHHF
jgi:hypothetical protein